MQKKEREGKEGKREDNTAAAMQVGRFMTQHQENLHLKQETVRFHAHCPILTVGERNTSFKHFCESQVYDGFNVMF